jgi:putative transposase
VLEGRSIAVSMDGRGRCLGNIFIERLWRSLKYEEVYLRDYRLVPEARAGIGRYFQFQPSRCGSHLGSGGFTPSRPYSFQGQ